MTARIDERVSFLGAGIIAEVWIARLLETGILKPDLMMACDVRPERLAELGARFPGIRAEAHNTEGARFARWLVLATPPTEVISVLREIRLLLEPEHVVVSLAAAVPLARLEESAGAAAVVRVMPNTASLVGEGMNVVAFGRSASFAVRKRVEEWLDRLGRWMEVPDGEMDAWCALCAVGPTYFFPVLDALAASAVAKGIPPAKALEAIAQVVAGVGRLVQQAGKGPEALKQMIGLRTMREDEARKLFSDAYDEAVKRLDALGRKIADAAAQHEAAGAKP